MEQIISINNLSYSFGDIEVLKYINLNVPKNSIYGFLGPNGAGKSTTIRILLNLIHVEHNKVFVNGDDVTKNRVKVLSNIGALIEHPSTYQHLSGRDNLKVTAKLLNTPRHRIAEVLEIVNLTKDADRKVKQYSLGMSQRLSLALALLNDPEILILDEPMNGLDPNGINEMRELIIKLKNDHGKTVFLSSHILSEIEKTATHIGIIDKGEIQFEGTMHELRNYRNPKLSIEVSNTKKAEKVILSVNQNPLQIKDNMIIMDQLARTEIAHINKLLVDNGVDVFQLTQQEDNLEDIFLNFTK